MGKAEDDLVSALTTLDAEGTGRPRRMLVILSPLSPSLALLTGEYRLARSRGVHALWREDDPDAAS